MNQSDDTGRTANEPDALRFTRRDFVRSAVGAAAAGPFLMNRWSLAEAGRAGVAGHAGTIRVGLIGCGGRGTGAAAQALNADPNVRITALADVFIERARSTRTSLDQHAPGRVDADDTSMYSGFDAYKQLINSGVDVVLMATPPVFRPIHLRAAIEAGKHVFCEKPVAVDAPGVRSVLESARMAKEKKLSLVSGFCWRYASHMRDTFNRLHDGALGEIRTVQSTYNTGPLADVARQPEWSDMEWQLKNWKAFIWASGDHIVEQAVHAIDWIHWAFKGMLPSRVFAVGGRIARTGKWTGNMYDHFSVIYEYENGGRGYHMCRQIANCQSDNTAFITGEKGTCSINPWGPRCVINTPDGEWIWHGQRNDMYQQEHDELFASIRNNTPMNDGELMAYTTLMGIIGREAAYTGAVIGWDEMLNSKKTYGPKNWEWGEYPFPTVPVPGQTEFI